MGFISSPDADAFFNRVADAQFSGRQAVRVFPLTYTNITAMAREQAPRHFKAYLADEAGAVRPVVAQVSPLVSPTYAVEPDTGRLDRSNPVGARVTISTDDADGNRRVLRVFTTPEAEAASRQPDGADAATDRLALFLPHTEGEDFWLASNKDLVPFGGASVDVTVRVKGLGPSNLAEQVEAVLREHFGHDMLDVEVTDTRPVSAEAVAAVFDEPTFTPVVLLDGETAPADEND